MKWAIALLVVLSVGIYYQRKRTARNMEVQKRLGESWGDVRCERIARMLELKKRGG